MDQRLLRYYNRELQHLREMGGEFAKEFPKIAGRLGLDSFECSDPYVERLLEGFAFLAARVQLKIDAEFPTFTQHLFESIFPHYLCPTPSMTIVHMQPDAAEGSLAEGYVVPRGSIMRSQLGRGMQTACEYRTAHDVTLYPIEIVEAQYYTRDVSSLDVTAPNGVRAAIRLRIKATGNLTFNKIALEKLAVHLRGGNVAMRIYEQLLANAVSLSVRPIARPAPWTETRPPSAIRRMGFSEDEALLPRSPRSFEGYRLVHEYFAFPERFLFIEIDELQKAAKRCNDTMLDLIVLLDKVDPVLEGGIDKSSFELHCTPAINLFPKLTDRIHLTEHQPEYHIVPDRTRPLDFEVYSVEEATGFGTGGAESERRFLPFYACNDIINAQEEGAYFALRRMPRLPSQKQRQVGPRSSYAGTETFISLVDSNTAPIRTDLRQLAVNTFCTNRDLPLHMPVGQGRTDFTLESGAPVQSIRCLSGPTRPRPSPAEGQMTWRILSHLSLHYGSLIDHPDGQGAAALRDMLMLYGETSDPAVRKQIEGVHSIKSEPLTRRVQAPGPITFARGLEVTVMFDETAYEGSGVFVLGAVMEDFFARYVSLNSFTETVVRTMERGEIIRWPARLGRRPIL